MRLWKKAEPKVQTPFGEFTVKANIWRSEIDTPSGKVFTMVGDVAGSPNPHFMGLLPEIVTTLPMLESTARNSGAPLTTDHSLDYLEDDLEDDDQGADFCLVFSRESDDDAAIRFSFKNGQLTGWGRDD